jgi:uncharacterized damage-inducible protein DinB
MQRRVWFDRKFTLGLPPEALPDIVERLRGTPLRLEERVARVSPALLTRRTDGRWSVQEHVGHLGDLEHLWLARLDDFAQRAATLRAADLQNRATWDADHNARRLDDLLHDFRRLRAEYLARVEAMSPAELTIAAAHPRLGQPMTVVDLCFFVAEHDDHHLATITHLRAAHDSARA